MINPLLEKFRDSLKADIAYCLPNQKEVIVTVLFKRVIGSLEPDVTTQVAYYKQNVTYKIADKHFKNWVLTASIQRNDVAQKECLKSDECLKKIRQGLVLEETDIPVRKGAYTAIIYLLSTEENEEYVKSPQPLTQDFSKNGWWREYVDVEFGKKTMIETDEVLEILASGKSCGFMSEDYTRRYI
jgi:hypothetical protein